MDVIPLTATSARFTQTVELSGELFTFQFSWNERAQAWFFKLLDSNEAELITGQRVIVGFPLLTKFRDARFPKGDLSAIDTSNADLDPLFDDLGKRVLLTFTPASELPAEFVG